VGRERRRCGGARASGARPATGEETGLVAGRERTRASGGAVERGVGEKQLHGADCGQGAISWAAACGRRAGRLVGAGGGRHGRRQDCVILGKGRVQR